MTFCKGDPNINRAGRPPAGETLTDRLRDALSKRYKGEEKTIHEKVIEKLIEKAIEDGDIRALEYLWDRIDGKIKEQVAHDGSIEIVFRKDK